MSDTTDPIIRASDLRRVLEAMHPACYPDSPFNWADMGRASDAAIAALPQPEAARATKPTPACERWVCQLHGHSHCGCEKRWLCECGKAASQHPAAPPEGEPPDAGVIRFPPNATGYVLREAWEAMRAYARHQRERAERAEAELAKLREQEPVVGEKFVRGWLSIAELPGGMMVGNGGRFGPVPAFTGCGVTTSEKTAAEWREHGKPALEVWTAPVPPADHAQALREARAEVWREAERIAELAGFSVLERAFAAKAREVSGK